MSQMLRIPQVLGKFAVETQTPFIDAKTMYEVGLNYFSTIETCNTLLNTLLAKT